MSADEQFEIGAVYKMVIIPGWLDGCILGDKYVCKSIYSSKVGSSRVIVRLVSINGDTTGWLSEEIHYFERVD